MIIKGRKVTLRERKPSDFDDYIRWLNDPEVNFWDEPDIQFSKESRKEILKYWSETRNRFGRALSRRWEIETLDGKHIGWINYRDLDYKNKSAQIGILMGKKGYWGKGYGSDAIKTLLQHLFKVKKLHRIGLETWSGNKRAIKCFEKCGFRIEGILRETTLVKDSYYDNIEMGILNYEWEEIKKNKSR